MLTFDGCPTGGGATLVPRSAYCALVGRLAPALVPGVAGCPRRGLTPQTPHTDPDAVATEESGWERHHIRGLPHAVLRMALSLRAARREALRPCFVAARARRLLPSWTVLAQVTQEAVSEMCVRYGEVRQVVLQRHPEENKVRHVPVTHRREEADRPGPTSCEPCVRPPSCR